MRQWGGDEVGTSGEEIKPTGVVVLTLTSSNSLLKPRGHKEVKGQVEGRS